MIEPDKPQSVKRLIRVTTGFGLVAAGGAMIFLPGPGVITVVAGLGLLGKEYDWARRLKGSITERLPWSRDEGSDQAGG